MLLRLRSVTWFGSGREIARRPPGSPWLAVAVCAAAVSAFPSSSPGGATADRVVTAEYSGVLDESFVYKPNDPAVWQQDFQLKWDEKETVTIGSDGRPAPGKPTITISGHIRSTYAPPNTAKSCTGTFSLRPNAPDPLMFSNDAVLALMPDLGKYVQSSSSSPDCAVAVNGAMGASGVLFPRPQLEQFSQAVAVVCSYSEDPCTKTFKVDGESPTNISSLRATFTVRGGTGGSRRPNR